MKSLYESLLTGKVNKPRAKEQPSSRSELELLIDGYIEEIKPRPGQEVDFNWIDISKVDDLSFLFDNTNYIPVIDKWEIDHVKSFEGMFVYNKHIVRSPFPVLQKKLLSIGCYHNMFLGCTSLTEPPVLPAKKLVKNCYTSMFYYCTSLVYAPELPAQELAESCYWGMFSDCTSLVNPPDLPAKNLKPYCYYGMFMGCTKLQTQAKVPNTVEISIHYGEDMYYSCPCNE